MLHTQNAENVENGEERQIAFGWTEDNPWESGDKRERGGITRIGGHSQNLAPRSRGKTPEGVSVNEWNDKKSININRTSRISALREEGRCESREN